ncbi:unnamed protein product [Closterium sp. NIES-54]
MYALADSAEGDCYLSVPPDPGIAAAALGASVAAALGASASAAPGAGASATPGGPVFAQSSTVLPCPAAPSGLLSGLHLPSFSTNLVSGGDLQDAWVDQFTLGGQRVTHCTCSWMGRHLATFTRRPGSSLYTVTTVPPPVPASGQVAASSQVFAAASRSSPASAPCSCHPLAHETLLWHHRLGQGHERYFLLVIDEYSCYTTVFPLRSKGEVPEVLIVWIRGARRQLSESFDSDLPVLRLHSDRGGEFSSDLLRAFCRSEGIRQTFTLPASPQQNGIAERRIGMVMDVARTSMIHAAAPHFLWRFAVQYAAHQIYLQPRVSLPETTPTLRWTGKVGDASAFCVWGSRAFVRDTTADKLSSRAIPCVFLGFPPDAPGWQFYHPTSRRVLSSQDITFDDPSASSLSGDQPGLIPLPGPSPLRPTLALTLTCSPPEFFPPPPGPLPPLGSWTTDGGAAGAGGAAGGAAGAEAAGGAAGTGDPGARGSGSVSAVSGGTVRPRPYYILLLQQVLGSPPSPGPPPPFLSPPLVQSQSRFQPASPLPGPSPYSGPTRGLSELREPESRPVSPLSRSVSPVRPVRTGRVLRSRPSLVPGTQSMTLRPSTAP